MSEESLKVAASTAGGGATGAAGSLAAVSTLGAVEGLSAAGITSGLATLGSLVGGGMAAGIGVAAAPVLAGGALAAALTSDNIETDEKIAAGIGAGAGVAGSVATVSAAGAVGGLSAAGITSGLAAVGGVVGGGTMQHCAAHRRILVAAIFAVSGLAIAHPIEPVAATDLKLRNEIAAFRKDFQTAGTNRDAAALRRYYTDDFTHTHTSGKVDAKDARIVSVVAGEQTVEMAPTPEFNLSCFGESVCIARAMSPIKRASDGKWFDVRWTQTYVKTSKGWQIAISQATGLLNTVREAQ